MLSRRPPTRLAATGWAWPETGWDAAHCLHLGLLRRGNRTGRLGLPPSRHAYLSTAGICEGNGATGHSGCSTFLMRGPHPGMEGGWNGEPLQVVPAWGMMADVGSQQARGQGPGTWPGDGLGRAALTNEDRANPGQRPASSPTLARWVPNPRSVPLSTVTTTELGASHLLCAAGEECENALGNTDS